jgi:RNA binding exosome subunit
MAFNKKEVDIEFNYLVSIKKSKHYKGTLTSIKESDVIETNIELELDL